MRKNSAERDSSAEFLYIKEKDHKIQWSFGSKDLIVLINRERIQE